MCIFFACQNEGKIEAFDSSILFSQVDMLDVVCWPKPTCILQHRSIRPSTLGEMIHQFPHIVKRHSTKSYQGHFCIDHSIIVCYFPPRLPVQALQALSLQCSGSLHISSYWDWFFPGMFCRYDALLTRTPKQFFPNNYRDNRERGGKRWKVKKQKNNAALETTATSGTKYPLDQLHMAPCLANCDSRFPPTFIGMRHLSKTCILTGLQRGSYVDMPNVLLLAGKTLDVTSIDKHVHVQSKAYFVSLLMHVCHIKFCFLTLCLVFRRYLSLSILC